MHKLLTGETVGDKKPNELLLMMKCVPSEDHRTVWTSWAKDIPPPKKKGTSNRW